jgi:hypothetical protein
VYFVDNALRVDPDHQLVAPNAIRSEALQLLLRDIGQGERTDKDAMARP